jgi:hypothetical protein
MNLKAPVLNVSPRYCLRLAPTIVAALIACCPLPMRGDTIALSFTGGTSEVVPEQNIIGWSFSLSNPIILTELGTWDGPTGTNGSIGDGLVQSHEVTILTGTGTEVVEEGIVPAGTGGTLTNGFRYISVPPVLLAPGKYVIGDFANNSLDAFVINASISTASGVSYIGDVILGDRAFTAGDVAVDGNNGYFGPNFQFISVPEASTWTLLLLGVTAMLGLKFFAD